MNIRFHRAVFHRRTIFFGLLGLASLLTLLVAIISWHNIASTPFPTRQTFLIAAWIISIFWMAGVAAITTLYFSLEREEERRAEAERALLETTVEERRQFSQHIHDGVGQLLTAIALKGRVIEMESDQPALVRMDANELVEMAVEAHKRSRAIAKGLDPIEFDRQDFVAALQSLLLSCTASFDITCTYEGPEVIEWPDNTTPLQLYLITQEAILNAYRHGKARHVVVRYEVSLSGKSLRISDDGKGLPVDISQKTSGMGLRIMENRAAQCGGTLEIINLPGHGTEVVCRLSTPAQSKVFKKDLFPARI